MRWPDPAVVWRAIDTFLEVAYGGPPPSAGGSRPQTPPPPDRHGYLFRADTHDSHCCPLPTSREYQPFRQLMEMNQGVAQAIESAWERQNLPTFKTFLK